MPMNLNSSRQRALSRSSLATLLFAILLALACQLLPAAIWGDGATEPAEAAACAPPEAATCPNAPTEPVRGLSTPSTAT